MNKDKEIIFKAYSQFNEEWLNMCVKCYIEVYKEEENCQYEKVKCNFMSTIGRDNSIGVVAIKENQCIGFITGNMYYIDDGIYTQVDEICVLKDERNKSVGSSMLKEFEEINKKHGSFCVCLEHFRTECLNYFYEKNGYFIPDDRVVRNKII